MNTHESKRILTGTVVSRSMAKTVTVTVVSTKMHPKYRKRYQTTKRYLAHDAKDAFKVGDVVRIRETRPISKRKHWTVLAKVGTTPAVQS